MLIEELKKSMFSIVEAATLHPQQKKASINTLSIKSSKEVEKPKDLNVSYIVN